MTVRKRKQQTTTIAKILPKVSCKDCRRGSDWIECGVGEKDLVCLEVFFFKQKNWQMAEVGDGLDDLMGRGAAILMCEFKNKSCPSK